MITTSYLIKKATIVAKKLRAVLNGADVIEMPSDEEIEAEANKIAEKLYPQKYSTCKPFNGTVQRGFLEGSAFIKSKIVK